MSELGALVRAHRRYRKEGRHLPIIDVDRLCVLAEKAERVVDAARSYDAFDHMECRIADVACSRNLLRDELARYENALSSVSETHRTTEEKE